MTVRISTKTQRPNVLSEGGLHDRLGGFGNAEFLLVFYSQYHLFMYLFPHERTLEWSVEKSVINKSKN